VLAISDIAGGFYLFEVPLITTFDIHNLMRLTPLNGNIQHS